MRNARESLGDGGPVELGIGALIGGKYRLIAALGEGGMGKVFEAENILTLKRAALKRLHPRMEASAAGQQRLLREARATSRVRHRNVVDLYDVIVEGNEVILVMELLLGELLSSFVARGSISFAQLVRLLLPAMEGVAAAHAVGVVHRDVKPENIFLTQVPGLREPVPKVIDFGISKIVAAEQTQLTRSGVALGTPRYASYEQLRGDRELDGRTDVYAFGVILYEALLGRPPYQGGSLGQQAVQFLTTAPSAPRALRPAVPEALSALVMSAIARDREDRLPSLSSFIERLSEFAHDAAYPQPLPLCLAGTLPLPSGAVGANLCTRPEGPPLERVHTTDPVEPRPVQTLRSFRAWPLWVCLGAACCAGVGVAVSRLADEQTVQRGAVEGLRTRSDAPARTAESAPAPTSELRLETAPVARGEQTSGASAGPAVVREPEPARSLPPRRAAARTRRAGKLVVPTPGALHASEQGDESNVGPESSPAQISEPSADSMRLRAGHVTRDEF